MSVPSALRPRLMRATVILVLAAAAGSTGCGLTEPDTDPVVFEGSFEALDPEATIVGEAVAVSQSGRTEMGLSANGLEPETQYRWHLRNGACDESGESVGDAQAYSPFTTDVNGSGTALGITQQRLRGNRSYAMEIFPGPVGESSPVACATLIRTE